ncbi:MAG: rhodanese-like domain-containing protein [Deltaproteobacteria bacterium]|jgi:rhodanese-related sulfurtransferase
MAIKKTIKEIIILLGVSLILALVVNTFSTRGIALVGQWDITQGVITANPAAGAAGRLQEIDSIALAKAISDKGEVLFVDARSQNDYENGHIPGAISLPVGQFEERIGSFLNRYPLEQPMVTYCSGRTCEDSHDLARFLSDVGFADVRIFIDGLPGWEAEGYPVE